MFGNLGEETEGASENEVSGLFVCIVEG